MKRKKNFRIVILLLLVCTYTTTSFSQKVFVTSSPDGKLKATVLIGKDIQYSVSYANDSILSFSPISMTLDNGIVWGKNSQIQNHSTRMVNQQIETPIYKRKTITDNCNELTLHFKEGFSLIFRAYNEGFAYRFVSEQQTPFNVKDEQAIFNFPVDHKAFIAYVDAEHKSFDTQYFNSFENIYKHTRLSEWENNRLAFMPIVMGDENGKKICITESDIISYPGMYLYPNTMNKHSLKGVFAPYPDQVVQGGYNNIQAKVVSRKNYIAHYDQGDIKFPWRIIVIAENDSQLADNDMVYKLSTPQKDADFSWVKPGKVAWEWWNDWNLFNVNFKAGINNETYKYYIDFASKYGIEYVILDDGWSTPKKADLFDIVPEINLEELVSYAKSKNVGLILWAGYYAFSKDMEGICRHYSQMGIKGFKIDFMDRDDQLMTDFHYKAAEIAARYKLILDYHGTYKPTGLQRTFPNVLNHEGIYGLEQLKFEHKVVDLVTYDVTFPFIRMLAGPVDYTQGAMRNATQSNFRAIVSEPMSMGTRCRQLAQYVIFESPLSMLCDSPSNYMREEECIRYIADIPTVWDNTIALNGKIGEYITIARQKGNTWYVGSMTNWDARTLEIDLSFLGNGNYQAEIFRDGINADKAACDYRKEIIDIPENRKLKISMAPGGGYAMKVYPKTK